MDAVANWLLTGAVPFLVLLGVLVFVHELGHFVLAKWSGMRVLEFALGFGPPLIRFVRGGTGYSVRAIPLGGFVKVAGMDLGEDPDQPDGFNSKPLYARFLTLLAGCFMNLLLAACVFCLVGILYGVPKPVTRIADVLRGSPADASGVKPGDRILAVNGRRVTAVSQVRTVIEQSPGRPVHLLVARKGREVPLKVVPRRQGTEKVGRIGIVFDVAMVRVGPLAAVRDGLVSTLAWTQQIAGGLMRLITGRVSASEIGGPVAIARATASQADMGVEHLLRFGGVISVNLALVNLIPFPGLDGARLAFLLIEAVRRKRFDPRKEAYVHAVGIAILFILLIVITGKDLTEWVQDLKSR
ncbi:MAG: RIP metalloprotease RseP [Armatimonadota bacterium]